MIGSFNSRTSTTDKPFFVLFGNSIIPSCLSDMVSSFSEHNIPSDCSPLILPLFKVKFKPGIKVPTYAKTPIIPTFTLWAPQTTLKCLFPSNTIHTLSLSALGCLLTSKTSTETNSLRSFAISITEATSSPNLGKVSTTWSIPASVSRCSSNHFQVSFMKIHHLTPNAN